MAKWLTKLTRPKLWIDYSFLLSVCVGDAEEEMICVVNGYDAAGVLLDTIVSNGHLATNQVVDFNIDDIWDNGYGGYSGVSYLTAYVKDSFDEVKTDVITIDVMTPCANAVMLMGRNSLGGVLQWLFDFSQEISFSTDNEEKAKRLFMSELNINQNQWLALQDFITLGTVYRNNIVEFLSTTNKTTSRTGQQIYVLSTTNTKIGVIAQPVNNTTLTRYKKNLFEIEIEYPIEFAV